jgi:glycogenin glucosyltransferase
LTFQSGIAAALSKLTLGQPKTKEQEEYEEHMRRQNWESGSVDYMGRDKFDNIWAKIQETINNNGRQGTPSRGAKSRSRSGTPKKDRSPTPPASDVVPGEKKEGK